jgi:hypothetical protein
MAIDPSVRIDIAAEFTGKKAFKQADTATAKLMKSVKSLAGGLGIAFGTKAVINFSKQAVKAFAEDEAAALRLSNAVDNLGIGFANVDISKFIADLERSAGIADDILRPAFQGLLTTTGSLVQSQKLLNDAITISRASGMDLATVSTDLAKGYVGITKGLAKYNTGLTRSELSTKSFNEILGILLKQSAGAASDYLGTTAYSMDVLSVATSNASEIIGGGLVDAFAAVGGGTEASDAAYVIETIATALANVTRASGRVIGVIPTLIKNLKNLPKSIFLGFAGAQAGVKLTPTPTPTPTPTALQLSEEERKKRLAKLEADAAKRAKALALLQSKQLANTKKQAELEKKRLLAEKAKAALSKAAAVFDLTKIQIAAALKATYDKDERLRLLAMQEIENDNGEAALKHLAELKLLTKEQQTNKLAGITEISQTELSSINAILLKELDRISSSKMTQEQADEARAEAYRKYNAAIIASGGLAEANFYTEKTQTDLLKIAKLAALHDVATAQATLDILNYTSQTDIIARIAAAQKIADDTKMKDLKDYLALLGTAAGIIGGLTGGLAIAKGAVEVIPKILPPGVGGGGQPIPPGYGGIFDYMPPAGSAGSSNSSVTVIVEGSVLDGNDFVEIVNDALLDANRRGLSRFPAGTLPDNG